MCAGSELHDRQVDLKAMADHNKGRDQPLFSDAPQDEGGQGAGRVPDSATSPWKIAIVDDDKAVHAVTQLVLGDFRYKGRPLQLFSEYSGAGAMRLLSEEPGIAVILLDVVMESEQAGLDVVKHVREVLNNHLVRIILRTGQPGQAPEREVIHDYDINDYKEKSDLSAQKLISSITTALRGYDDLLTIQSLTTSKEELEQMVQERTKELVHSNRMMQQEMADRLKVLEALTRNQALLAEAQKIANIGNYEWNIPSGEMVWSDQIYRILELPADKVTPGLENLLHAVPVEDQERVSTAIRSAITLRLPFSIEHPILRGNGPRGFVHQQGEVHYDADGAPVRLVGIMQDITERHNAEQTMRKLSAALEQTADAVMITDSSGNIEYVNAAFTTLTGYTSLEACGNTPRMLKSGQQPDIFYRRLWNAVLKGEVFSDIIVNKRKDGSFYYESKTITPQKDRFGQITHFISTGKDITEQMLLQEQMQHLAHHDALTGLPNRILLMDRLEQAIARSRWRQRHVAVLFLDMDRFKVINDTLGHTAGDQLLTQMAERLQICVREGDTVARLGGDEFAIILNDIATIEDVAHRVQKILDAVKSPFSLEGRDLFVTTSIGISMHPEDGDNGQLLLKRADVAMYKAKISGKNNFQFYTDRDESKELEKFGLETDLRRALERHEFFLVYQPQVDAASKKINGMEALLRWRHPSGRIVPPLEFIPLLEETGMILAVGDWVLQAACAQAQALREEGLPPQTVAVNISLHQFRQPGFVQRVRDVLQQTGLAPEYLELEITEGVLIDNVKEAAQTLEELSAVGVSLSIDDFGTGYSSMHYLRRLPFDVLKIDKSFVQGLPYDKDDGAIVTAIITLAHSMELKLVAEGVETREQFEFVSDLGCHSIQGYFFSNPVSDDEFRLLVSQGGFPEQYP
jgi:diguanylate cyclase (GGDEF)-like protein/PAS domain S-box-containing protein